MRNGMAAFFLPHSLSVLPASSLCLSVQVDEYIRLSESYLTEMESGQHDNCSPPPSPGSTPKFVGTVSTRHLSEVLSGEQAAEEGKPGGGAYWALTGWYDHPQPGSRLLQYGMTSLSSYCCFYSSLLFSSNLNILLFFFSSLITFLSRPCPGMGWTPDRRKNPTVVYQSWLSDSGKVRVLFLLSEQ